MTPMISVMTVGAATTTVGVPPPAGSATDFAVSSANTVFVKLKF